MDKNNNNNKRKFEDLSDFDEDIIMKDFSVIKDFPSMKISSNKNFELILAKIAEFLKRNNMNICRIGSKTRNELIEFIIKNIPLEEISEDIQAL